MHILTRRSFLETASLAAALGLTTRAAGQPAPAQTAFTPIRRNVGYFTGQGGTIGWLASPDALAVVDSQFPATAQACLDGLKQKVARRIDLLANTHHHGDHTGGNAVFRPEVGFILAHENVPKLMARAAQGQSAPPAGAIPDRTFTTAWGQDLRVERLTLRHYGPAHTSGDAVATFEKANVAHMGDLMFHHRHPFVDRPAGASIANWITVLEQTVKDHENDTIYIFGHAKPGLPVTGGRADLMRMRDYLTAVLETVRTGIAAGRSRDEITAAGPLKGFEDYQESPPRLTLASVLGVAYDELRGN